MNRKHEIIKSVIGDQEFHSQSKLIGVIEREVVAMMAKGPIPLTELARRLLLTCGHLNRKVKASLGITLQQLVALIQVDRAAALLKRSQELKIHEVATLCGFDSASSFSRTFGRVTGSTPSQYRLNKTQ